MDVIGNGRCVLMNPVDEHPHEPGSDPNWQESVVIYLFDAEQQCYVFFRLGHELNRGSNGTAVIWSNIWVPGQYYKYYEDVPLQPGDRFSNGFASGSKIRYGYDGKHHWAVEDGDISADLVMEDWHQPFDFWPTRNNLAEIAPHHMEASGTITGTIKFKGKTYTIKNGIGHRDHSWGVRRWEAMLTHRWTPAIFGRDFVSHALAMMTDDGRLQQLGFVIRDNKFYVPTDVSVGCLVEADGLTNRGGNVIYTLPSGEKLEVVFWNIVPGGFSFHGGYPCFDPISVVSCGERTGFGVMECGNNTMRGKERPRQDILISGYIDNGIFPYQQGTSRIRHG
jgi:hypothetical protein